MIVKIFVPFEKVRLSVYKQKREFPTNTASIWNGFSALVESHWKWRYS